MYKHKLFVILVINALVLTGINLAHAERGSQQKAYSTFQNRHHERSHQRPNRRHYRHHSKRNYYGRQNIHQRHSHRLRYHHRTHNNHHYYYNQYGFYFPGYGYISHGHQHRRHCPSWHHERFAAAIILSTILSIN